MTHAKRTLGALLLFLAVPALVATGCSKRKEGSGSSKTSESGSGSGQTAPSGGGIVKVDGSSTVFLISQAVAEEFQRAGKGDVTVGASGTGGGFKKFCRGELDVSGASRPIKTEEAETCKSAGIDYIELAVAYDGLAVVVNKAADWVDNLTVAELKKMWEPEAADKITNWSQIRDGWPDKKLVLFGPGTDSGTYDYFTQAIVGKEHSSRGDYTSNEDDNVLVTGVAGDPGALGFFGYAYFKENQDKLKVVPIDGGNGPVTPSEQTVNDGTYQPLSRPIFIYVSTKALAKGNVQAFVEFYLEHAKELAADVGYIALPDDIYTLVKKRYADKTTGSVFSGGSQVGVTFEGLMKAEHAGEAKSN
ncbi:MAG: phosphate ABC transporter substrate-binding protein PstS family protein [Kofleriaceae bacterium]|nr:phosphate ABC transporter substrate-binding protein PstS family protein [Myxococcales bacterium]MCB9561315.1 phosphate ABC transporter substrate-binding protein PstS family protein [Kofleriaceae bacterium]MCB9574376.1 phosphate ABC transporter substrate-binding protein PstS family protein [Kofleriaceae bacterium]